MLSQISEGTGAAAGGYQVLGTESTIQVYAGNKTRDAVTITVMELIYGVTFSFTVARTIYNLQGIQALAAEYAGVVESIGGMAPVVGITYTQDVNAAGLLGDYLFVTVADPTGENTLDVKVPFTSAFGTATQDAINGAYTTLLANI